MATSRANFNSVISADATQFHATMRRVSMSAKAVGARISKSMTNATRAMGRVAARAGKAAVAIGAIGSAIAAAAFTSAVKEMYDLGGSLSDLASRTGIAVGELAILQRAFKDNGLAAEKVGPIINKMQKGITDFGAGLSTQVRAFERLGISYDQIREKSPLQQFQMIQTALAGVSNQSVRTATAMEIFGRAGGELQALFDDAGAVEKATKSLGSAADILERNAQTFDRISDLMQSATANLKLFVLGVAEVAAPKILAALEKFDSIDFADLGVRFVKGLNLANVLSVMKATFDVAVAYLGNGLAKVFQEAARMWGDDMMSALDDFIFSFKERFSRGVKDGLKTAFTSKLGPLGFAKAVDDSFGKMENVGFNLADAAISRIEQNKDIFNLDEKTENLNKVLAKWMGYEEHGPPKPSPQPGSAAAAMDWEAAENGQKKHKGSPILALDIPTPMTDKQIALSQWGMKASAAMSDPRGAFKGLASHALMQQESIMGIGPGKNNAFARDRRRLGIGSGLSTGGLGAKRAVGRTKDEAELKRQTELAKSSEEHLMDIKEKIGKSLSVAQ